MAPHTINTTVAERRRQTTWKVLFLLKNNFIYPLAKYYYKRKH